METATIVELACIFRIVISSGRRTFDQVADTLGDIPEKNELLRLTSIPFYVVPLGEGITGPLIHRFFCNTLVGDVFYGYSEDEKDELKTELRKIGFTIQNTEHDEMLEE